MIGGSVGKWEVVGTSVGQWSVGLWSVVLIKPVTWDFQSAATDY